MSASYNQKKAPSLNNEIENTRQVLQRMRENGLENYSILEIDYNFRSDKKNKLEKINELLKNEFEVKQVYLKSVSFLGLEYELSISLKNITYADDLILYLNIYLYGRARETDCVFGDWGALIDNKLKFDNSKIVSKELMAQAYEKINQGKKYLAFKDFYLLATNDLTGEANFNLGCMKYDFGAVQDAIRSFDRAIQLNPKNPTPYLNRGVAFFDLEEYEKAINDYKMIVALGSKSPDPFINLGNAYTRLNKKKEAVEFFDKAIEMGSEDAVKAKNQALKFLH